MRSYRDYGNWRHLMGLQFLTDAARWTLIAIFGLAGAEKVVTLRSGSAAWHPVMLRSIALRKHATAWMALALAADTVVIAALIFEPAVGGALSAGLVCVYTFAGVRGQQQEGDRCRCFLGILDTTTRVSLLARNAMLALFGATVALLPVHFGVPALLMAAAMLLVLWFIVLVLNRRFGLSGQESGIREVPAIPLYGGEEV